MTEITRKGLLGVGAAGVAGLAIAAPAQAHDRDDDHIVGSWFLTITADDPALGSFNGLISFHAGGVVTESRRYYIPATPLGPLLETSGHGAWKGERHGVTAFWRFMLQQAPPSAGAPVGTDNVRINVRLERGGRRFSGSFESKIRDNSGAVVFTATGDIVGERIIA
jgi:hypothetical protein